MYLRGFKHIVVSNGHFYCTACSLIQISQRECTFNSNEFTLSMLTWIGFSMGLSLACFHLVYGGRKQLTTYSISNISLLMCILVLSKVVVFVAHFGKS